MLGSAIAVATTAVIAQVPADQLMKPPADARHFVIQSTGGKHGDSWTWVSAEGARMGRESMKLSSQVFELDSRGTPGQDGMPASVVVRGVTPQGDAAEWLTIEGGTARWKSPIDQGTAPYAGPTFYLNQGGPIDLTAWMLEALLARPDKTLNLPEPSTARGCPRASPKRTSSVCTSTAISQPACVRPTRSTPATTK